MSDTYDESTQAPQRSNRSTLIRRVLVTVAAIAVFRIGSSTPLPGVVMERLLYSPNGGSSGVWSLFSGGLLTRGSVFALSIAPFITAVIVMQLLEASVPALAQLRRDGVVGQNRRKKIVRVAGMAVAAVQAALTAWNMSRASSDGLRLAVLGDAPALVLSAAVALFVGYLMCMWLAEMISRHGFGNGVTVILVSSLAATAAPGLRFTVTGLPFAEAAAVLAAMVALIAVLGFAHLSYTTVLVASASAPVLAPRTRVPLQLKLLGGGVTPLIFASSLLGAVVSLTQRFAPELTATLSSPLSVWHAALLWVLCAGFSRLWARTAQDPVEMTNELTRTGRHIPGQRPGWHTAQYLHDMTVITALAAAAMLAPVLFAPVLLGGSFGIPVLTFIGVPLVILTSSLIELRRQAREFLLLDRTSELLVPADRSLSAAQQARRDSSAMQDRLL
jgi:preprotein translocase subunit SecY